MENIFYFLLNSIIKSSGLIIPVIGLIVLFLVSVTHRLYKKNPIIFKEDLEHLKSNLTNRINNIEVKNKDIITYEDLCKEVEKINKRYNVVSEKFNEYVKKSEFEKLNDKVDILDKKIGTQTQELKEEMYRSNDRLADKFDDKIQNLYRNLVDLITLKLNK
jgi:predicted  nucleic acid-binding Zn-ribbon protein